MIKGYYAFLFESILMTSPQFEDVIKGIDDQVSKDFLELINKDIKTPFNALDSTDKNDKVSFVGDSQFQNKIKSGVNPLEVFAGSSSNKTSVGRLVRQILKDNSKEYTDDQISNFVDGFKSSWEKIQSKGLEESPIRLVSGEEIRYWYNESNYCEDTIRKSKGTLGKSCMRYADCQNYLNIYVENPSVCKLLILVHENKLRARALYWITDKGNYLDRIYYTDSSESNTLEDWVADNDKNSIIYSTSTKLTVQLESNTGNYNDYPYMDSMVYYYIIDKKLYNYEPKVGVKRELLYCQDTEGGYDRQNMVYCEYTDEELPEDEVVNSNYHSSYIPKRRAVRSEYFDDWIHEDEAKHSDYLGDYIPDDESVNVYLDEDQSDYDYFPRSHKDIAIDEDDDEYYLKSLMMEVGGSYYLKSKLIELFVVKDNSVGEYNKIFNIINSKAAVIFESDPVCSYVVKEFYNLDVDVDRNWYGLKGNYYTEVYMNVDYQKMYDELYDNDDASEVIEELEEANLYLKIKYPKKYPRK